jgi:Flp pilus assembly protein protease CpaA
MRGSYEIALFALLIVATVTDLLWGKIFNWLTFPFLLTGLIARFAFGGVADLQQGLWAIAIAFALFFPLYAVRAIAAGDAKLLMAMAAWMDSKSVIEVAAIAIVIGAGVGLFSLLRQKGFRGSAASVAENVALGAPTKNALKMPFGPAFLCAYVVVNIAQLRHWELL